MDLDGRFHLADGTELKTLKGEKRSGHLAISRPPDD